MQSKQKTKYTLAMYGTPSSVIVVESSGYESIFKHTHEFVEFVFVESGVAMHEIGDDKVTISEGDCFVLANGEEHSIQPKADKKEFAITNYIFAKSVVDIDYTKLIAKRNIIANSEIKRILEQIKYEYSHKFEYYNVALAGLMQLLLTEFLRLSKKKRDLIDAETEKIKYCAENIKKALNFIHSNYSSQIDLESIANHVGLYKGYLQELFRREHNASIIQYLIKYRIEQACKLLAETEYSVQRICEEVGYSDLKNFYVNFKKRTGLTPKKFREDKKAN